ncbi:intracellular signal transduction [Ascochyta rabiei]|uniref:Vacuolar membrane-associated protein IML1 n=2 Tax=Didymella rabiei TaxID=5454 RepID=A0A163K7G7_DIDRA|nr:intracellular signal transduction [Ascochyta rabiei]
MPKSIASSKQARVQKICTLWTHDENFSRDDVVFNSDRFPELPITPGSLLQIVAVNPGTAVRDFSSSTKVPPHDSAQAKAESVSKDAAETQSRRSRRGSFSKTIDENGSIVPGGRDIDTEKTYIFAPKPLPHDLKPKHTNLQISIAEKIAKVFGFRNRMQVIITEADEARHEAHHVELVFRDEYLARADMWRMAIAELSRRTVYRGQKLLFMGTIKATVKQIYIDGQSVHSGYFSPTTKPIFRSESARYVLFIQMSREMWDFDAEGAGEIMFNKVVSGFLPDLFKRWLKINAKHVVTIILFTRMQYDEDTLVDCSDYKTNHNETDSNTDNYRDYYRVVVSDMASGDWIKILHQLKVEFRTFLREVSLVSRSMNGAQDTGSIRNEVQDPEVNTIIAGKPSSASQGNILEAINLAAAQFSKDHIDRDLVRTGISVVVITPGTGVFEVDYNMLKLTTDTLVGSGIGIDLVCLSPMPLHSVPLFKYRNPSVISDSKPKRDNDMYESAGAASEVDEKTPKQNRPNFRSKPEIGPIITSAGHDGQVTPALGLDHDWKFAMPYWVDVSFWSRPTDDVLELTKTRTAHRVVKRSHRKHRTFSLRCRLYELQMMGVIENELGDISLPYLEEEHSYERAYQKAGTHECRAEASRAALNVAETSTGSFSSRGDRDCLDSRKTAYKAWMDDYDVDIFFPASGSPSQRLQPSSDGKRQSELESNLSSGPSKESFLSTSFRSIRTITGRNARPSPDMTMHQASNSRTRSTQEPSPRSGSHRFIESRHSAAPRADVVRRQKFYGNITIDNAPPRHSRKSSGESHAPLKSVHSTPNKTPTSSQAQSPLRRAGLPATPTAASPAPVRESLKPRPSNWFLRQISFGGKAAPVKPTLGDATTDISQGQVKPAMLTIEKSQKGAIAERLASTRLISTEKPSQPIAIRSSSRAGISSTGSPSPDQNGRSVETVRELRTERSAGPSHPGSVKKDPGSTFLLAGGRIVGDTKPNLDVSSSVGGKDAPKTLSPTSAIAPWAVLVNPCNPKKNVLNAMNQYRRWHHVFPRTLRTGTMKWRSLCSPAAVPLTHEWFPTAEQLSSEYNESPYKITQSDDEELPEAARSRETLIRELIAFRLSHGFQIITGSAVAEFSGRQEKSLAGVLAPGYMASEGDTVFMTVGTSIHQLVCVASGEVEVKRYHRKPTTALESSAGVDTPFSYRPYIRTAFEPTYEPRDITLQPPRKEYNWNFIDTFLAGYQEEFSDVLRFWRARFVLIPVEIPCMNRRPLPMLAEDSEEEVRLEGIRKLTQLWQRYRYFPPEERFSQGATCAKQKDPNPLAIEYHTRDPSAVVAAGPVNTLFNRSDGELAGSTVPDADKYHTSNMDLKKLAEDLQSERGIPMLDRRWHWKLHYNCFLGFDLTNWLLNNFKDVDSREGAVDLGNQLMERGLFQHVQRRHPFRDGNFFFQIAAEYRAPRPESRAGWFGLRKVDKSVPSTPLFEGPRTSPLAAKGSMSRPSTAESSSGASESAREGERIPTREGAAGRKVTLSRAMRYDVDPRKRSYRSEIISLHYDLVHNPDNCYHIRIDWMNVTAKLIEDAIVTWATSVEKYGLKLVEVPIAELAKITDYHPFRSPYQIKLAMQPPQNQTEAMWDSMHFSAQYSRTDKFAYHKALLRKLHFVLDTEAANAFPSDVEVSYSWGRPDYQYTQFIHRTGGLLAQISEEGHFLVLANRLAHNRAKDMSRIRPLDLHEHKKVSTDGSQSSRLPSTAAVERGHAHRSPFSSPLARPVQDASLLHTALERQSAAAHASPFAVASQTPEQVKDELEAFCSDAALLAHFYSEAFKQAPSPSPRILPVLDNNIPSLGLPPAISIREASPGNAGWTPGATLAGRGAAAERMGGVSEMGFSTTSGVAGRRQGSEGSVSTLGKRGSITESLPKRQDSQGSAGGGA